MSKYDEMSDFEINQEVARVVTDGEVISFDDMMRGPTESSVQVIYKIGVHGWHYDYCNNPADAWPIIIENDIEITNYRHAGFKTGKYMAQGAFEYDSDTSQAYPDITVFDKNPLRAAMICFLKMQEA